MQDAFMRGKREDVRDKNGFRALLESHRFSPVTHCLLNL